MGIKSTSKPNSARRNLSSRPISTPTSTPINKSKLSNEIVSTSPLTILGSSLKSKSKSKPTNSPSTSASTMGSGSKRNAEELEQGEEDNNSNLGGRKVKRIRNKKPKKGILQDGIKTSSNNSSSSNSKSSSSIINREGEEDELEEGEIDGDFSDLFMVDTTPSIVLPSIAYVDSALISPTKLGEENGEASLLNSADQEEADMLAFADEVAMSSDESDEESEEEEDEEVELLYDDPDTLKRAIAGKITDDSAAKVTGRYYKEADLTRSCGLCGEQGHSSRDCTHSQCFTCGLVDGDHEARNCPVTLVCTSCGSRGHYNRNCPAPTNRTSYGSRCATCSSTLHPASNCPLIWRVYDTTGAKPHSHRITYACANDGSTNDHFIDDCLLPRMHPIRLADSSAFNRAALGSNPGPPRGSSSSSSLGKRSGAGGSAGASGSASSSKRRGGDNRRQEEEEDEDDDWFASRGKQQQQQQQDRNSNESRHGSRGRNGTASNSQHASGKKGKSIEPYTGGGIKARANRERKQHMDVDGPPPAKGVHISKGYKKDKNYRNVITNSRSLGGGSSGSYHGDGRTGGAQSGGRGKRDDYESNYRDSRDNNRGGGGGGGGNYDSPRDMKKGRDRGDSRSRDKGRNNGNSGGGGGGSSLSDRMEPQVAAPSRYSGSYF